MSRYESFEVALGSLIINHDIECDVDAPPRVLAAYLVRCLEAYEDAQTERDKEGRPDAESENRK